jgi:hypothetical protein
MVDPNGTDITEAMQLLSRTKSGELSAQEKSNLESRAGKSEQRTAPESSLPGDVRETLARERKSGAKTTVLDRLEAKRAASAIAAYVRFQQTFPGQDPDSPRTPGYNYLLRSAPSGEGAEDSFDMRQVREGFRLSHPEPTGLSVLGAATDLALPSVVAGAAKAARTASTEGKVLEGSSSVWSGRGSTTFYHGAPTEAAEATVAGGIKPVSTATHRHPAGSFFTHEASAPNALESASQWPVVQGKTSSGGVGVVEMKVPNAVLRRLEARGLVKSGEVPGLPFFPKETVFHPDAFKALNKAARFRVIPPRF